MKRFFFVLLALLPAVSALAGREVYDIGRGWKFYTVDRRDSVGVTLPHTWNDTDAAVGRLDYYRGIGNYFRYLKARPEWRGKRVFVRFYGAGTVADLMVNGRHAGEHRGGNNAFEFEITDLLDYGGKNLLWVIVNNGARLDVLPTAGEENVYGGLFRQAEIIVTEPAAIGFDGYGGCGVLFATERADTLRASGSAAVTVNVPDSRHVQLDMRILDARDSVVFSGHAKHRADGGLSVAELPFEIERPHLWQGTADPYLYTVTVVLADGTRTDSVSFRTGLRTFSVDAARGFFLNGISYPLRGVVLWRDQAFSGPVFNEEELRRDMRLIREMGANAVRVAGGTHHPAFYELCDEEGVVVLADGPFAGTSTLDERGYFATPAFRDNAERQFRELVCQRYNNPSVAFWGIFADPEILGDDPIPFIGEMNRLVKSLDPGRLTVGISNKDGDVNRITDLVVWNHTFGWKTGLPGDIAIWRDQLRGDAEWRKIRSGVSYRVGGIAGQYAPKLVRPDPASGWHPENWQAYVHEVHIGALADERAFWGVFVGDMFDHGSVRTAAGGLRGVNDCGLVTFDRQVRKDAYWLYKANWNREDPFIHIASVRERRRSDKIQTVTGSPNLPVAELCVNGVSLGTRVARNGVMKWDGVQLRLGENGLRVFAVIAGDDDYVTVEETAVLTCRPGGGG